MKLTRILLPAQLCFFAGGVFGAVLLVRKQFNVQAVAPLIYNLGTIVGGLLLVKKLGVSSLAHWHGGGRAVRAVPAECGILRGGPARTTGPFSTGTTKDCANGCGYHCR